MTKKRVLIGGNGNISQALLKLIERYHDNYDITVSDLWSGGQDVLDVLNERGRDFDVVVNLTTAETMPIYTKAIELGIDYIDAGISCCMDETITFFMREMRRNTLRSRIVWGVGMNPGLVQHIFHRHKPQGRFFAIQVEIDTAERGDEVFCTWSPLSYYEESMQLNPYISHAYQPILPLPRGSREAVEIDGKTYTLKIIPHEETIYMTMSEPNCMGCGFFYQAPHKCQEYFDSIGPDVDDQTIVATIPCIHRDIKGNECVGLIFYELDNDNQPYFAFNKKEHREAIDEIGFNATTWQTACGVYVVLKMLEEIEPTGRIIMMSDISEMYTDMVDKILEDLHFDIQVRENFMSREEVEMHFLKWFNQAE